MVTSCFLISLTLMMDLSSFRPVKFLQYYSSFARVIFCSSVSRPIGMSFIVALFVVFAFVVKPSSSLLASNVFLSFLRGYM